MNKIKLNSDMIKFLSLFQAVTRTGVKDCIDTPERLVFVVDQNQISKAIGKNGENIRRVERGVNRKIKIVELNPRVCGFVKNLIYPNKASNIEEKENIITITPVDTQTRGRLIGRSASNLRMYESIAKRYFNIEEIKVV